MPAPTHPIAAPKKAASEHITALAALGVRRRYPKGVLLMQEGDFGDIVYVMNQGRAKVFATDDDQREIPAFLRRQAN